MLSTLMRLESRLAFRVSRAQAGGVPLARLGHVVAECWALRWALAELSRIHPAAAEFARLGFEKEQDRRRGGGTSA
jgi:hypothetical protein